MSAHALPMPVMVYCAALRATALWVPREQRTEWLAEWIAELRYVCEAHPARGLGRGFPHREVAAFCCGAIDDARCLRGLHGHEPVRAAGSAVSCVVWLALAVLLFGAMARWLPGVRDATGPSVYRNVTDMVTIMPAGAAGMRVPSMRLETVRAWQGRPQHLFTEFGFYQIVVKPLSIGVHHEPELRIARASNNMMTMLGGRVMFAQADDGAAVLMLSESVWRTEFGGDTGIFGQTVKMGLDRVRVGGVVPDETAPAGGRVDAWMLLPESAAEALPDSTRVFVVGRTAAQIDTEITKRQRWQMTAPEDGELADFDCVALRYRSLNVWFNFVFAALLALLSLPAITAVTAGEYSARNVKVHWAIALRRWMFLMVKILLAVVAIYFASLDVAYAKAWPSVATGQYIQLTIVFCATLFALQWALRDQGQRCPVCLGRLRCPARVGHPSRNFLTWNGTELMCTVGHGLLHVPEMPTSWFNKPRWLQLDASWKSLFPRPA